MRNEKKTDFLTFLKAEGTIYDRIRMFGKNIQGSINGIDQYILE
jgi:hypothetical protein